MIFGSYVALITPFLKGKIDHSSLETLIEWQIAEGIDGIVALGTTGEASTLSDRERTAVIKTCVRVIRKRVPLIIGTGTNDTRKSLYYTLQAKKLGADGALVVVPYYSKPTQEGSILHFKEIAKASFPLILYHHPGRTGVTLSLETIALMEKAKIIAAIKECSCNLSFLQDLIKQSQLPIFAGDDALLIPSMEIGAKGIISVCANLAPHQIKKITSLCLAGNFAQAKIEGKKIEKCIEAIFLETNPQGIKYALHLLRGIQPTLRLPLIEPQKSVKTAIEKAMQDIEIDAQK